MGEVLVAHDPALRRDVAYKRLHQEHKADAELRFRTEIQITAQLDHPNIIPVYALDETGDELGYSMKLVRGITLQDLIAQARSASESPRWDASEHLDEALEHFLKICDAIDYAHSRGTDED